MFKFLKFFNPELYSSSKLVYVTKNDKINTFLFIFSVLKNLKALAVAKIPK